MVLSTAEGFVLCYFVFFFYAGTALELYLDAVVVYDDLFDQLLDDALVICVEDIAAADVFLEAIQPRLDLCVS